MEQELKTLQEILELATLIFTSPFHREQLSALRKIEQIVKAKETSVAIAIAQKVSKDAFDSLPDDYEVN